MACACHVITTQAANTSCVRGIPSTVRRHGMPFISIPRSITHMSTRRRGRAVIATDYYSVTRVVHRFESCRRRHTTHRFLLIHTYIHAYTHIYTHIHTYAYIHTCTYTHTYIDAHMHMRTTYSTSTYVRLSFLRHAHCFFMLISTAVRVVMHVCETPWQSGDCDGLEHHYPCDAQVRILSASRTSHRFCCVTRTYTHTAVHVHQRT